MVAIVSGNSLGLSLTSLGVLGQRGTSGTAGQGRNGELAYVNVANGNLVLQDLDDKLVGRGADIGVVRTYNSQGLLNDSTLDPNADNWLMGAFGQRMVLTGTVGTSGSTLVRTDRDGASATYTWNASRSLYVSSAGSGAFDTIGYDAATSRYVWTDGATGLVERYESTGAGRLMTVVDLAGNTITYAYNSTSGLLQSMVDANGETTFFDYDAGNNLTQIRTVATGGSTTTRVRYAYDSARRLSTVTVDLSPEDNAVADGKTYVTTYGYDGTSKRVASVTQSDGTSLAFTYVLAGGSYKVATVTDALGQVTRFAYDTATGTTTVTDPLGAQSTYLYDAQGQLLQMRQGVTAANPSGLSQISYRYDAAGNVTGMTDGEGREVAYEYDANGNLLKETDSAGNLHTRSYNAANQLLTETFYADAAVSRGAFSQPASLPEITRYVYAQSNPRLLRFVLSPQGDVTEHRYDSYGQAVTTVRYTGGGYNSALAAGAVPTEAQMITWAAPQAQDLRRTERTDRAYDARGALSSSTVYGDVDATGAGVAASAAKTQYVYDQHGWLLKTIEPTGGGTTTYVYDGLGRVLSVSAPSLDGGTTANTTVTSYDDAGGKTTVTVAGGLVSVSAYDKAGRLVSVTQQSAGTGVLGATKYAYDKDGNLLMTQDPTGVRQWMLYDAAGRKIADIDATGALVEYVYNANGQLRQTVAYATKLTTAKLASLVDGAKLPTTAWSATNTTTSLAALRPGQVAQDQKVWRFYDNAGRLAWQVDALGYVTQTTYDGASRVLSVSRLANAIDVTPLLNGADVNLGVDPTTLGGIALSLDNVEPTPLGQGVKLTATFEGVAPGGMVTFFDGETIIGSAAVIDSKATLLTNKLWVGIHNLRVAYSGDALRPASVSKAVKKEITGATTGATLSLSANSLTYGQPVVMSVALTTTQPPGLAAATGEVKFYNGTTLIGTATIINGLAMLAASDFPTGSSTIRAEYAGDAVHAAAVSMQALVVKPTSTVITLSTNMALGPFGTIYSFEATVIAAPGGRAAPSGTVTFYSGTTAIGTASLIEGIARFPFYTGEIGAFNAVYSGDIDNATSSTRDRGTDGLSVSAITLSEIPVSVDRGTPVRLTAWVSGGMGGTVSFFSGTTFLGSSSVIDDVARFSIATDRLPLGVNVVTAAYSGFSSYYSGGVRDETPSIVATARTVQVNPFKTTLLPGQSLKEGESIFSEDGRYQLILQTDGNLVVYDRLKGPLAIWSSQTSGRGAKQFSFQNDGNMVLYTASGTAIWDAKTFGLGGQRLVLQIDGNLVLYAPGNSVKWFTGGLNSAPPWMTLGQILDTPSVAANAVVASLSNGTGVVGFPTPLSALRSTNGDAIGPFTGGFSIFDGQTLIACLLNPSGGAVNIPALSVGTHNLTIVYSGDAKRSAAMGTMQVVVESATSRIAVTSSRSPSTLGSPITITAKIAPDTALLGASGDALKGAFSGASASGTVTFYDRGNAIGRGTLVNGVATLIVGDLPLGTASITVDYSGDVNYKPVTSTAFSQQVVATTQVVPTSTSLKSSRAISSYGAILTLTSTVKSAPGAPALSGTVQFYNGATLLGSANLVNGQATLTTSQLMVGTNTLSAIYSGDTASASSSAEISQVVTQAATTISLATSATSANQGTPVTLTAQVTGASVSGLVTFFAGNTFLGIASVVNGTAVLITNYLPLGSNVLKAAYAGDANNSGSVTVANSNVQVGTGLATSAPQVAANAIVATRMNGEGIVGFPTPLSVLRPSNGDSSGPFTGTFSILDGQTLIASLMNPSGGAINIPALSLGTHNLMIVYSGDAKRSAAMGAMQLVVGPTASSIAVTSSRSPATLGSPITLTAKIAPDAAPLGASGDALMRAFSGASASGTVTFYDRGSVIGRGTLVNGVATLTLSDLLPGTASITVGYAGDTNYKSATSAAFNQQVVVQPVSTYTSVVSSASSAPSGSPITFTATTNSEGNPALSGGTVSFYDGATLLGTSALVDNKAVLTVSDLGTGSHIIKVVYSGDASSATSTSYTDVDVTTAPVTLSNLTTASIAKDGSLSVRVNTVSGVMPTGMVTFYSGTTSLGTVVVGEDGTATLRGVPIPAGTHTFSAVYSGDALNADGAITFTQTVTGTSTPTVLVGLDAGQDRTTTQLYNRNGQLQGTLDAEGYLTEYKYNAAGEQVQTIRYASRAANFASVSTRMMAVAIARASGDLKGLRPVDTSPDDIRTYSFYNARGQLVGQVDGEGYFTETTYDLRGNVTQTKRYLKPAKSPAAAGATLATVRPDADPLDQVVTQTWSAANQLLSRTNVEGTVTSFTYDLAGRLVQTSTAAGTTDERIERQRYDIQGRLIGELDGRGSAAVALADPLSAWTANGSTHAYDAAGRRTSTTDANGRRTLFFYDALGRLTYSVNALGEVTENRYDALGQLSDLIVYGTPVNLSTLGTTTPGGLNTDILRGLVDAVDDTAKDRHTVNRYNATGTLASNSVATSGTTNNLTSYSYNAFREVTASSQTRLGGQVVTNTVGYDRRGLKTSSTADATGAAAARVSRSIGYDAFGRATTRVDGNGNAMSIAYDRLGRVVTTTDATGAKRVATYDAFDRVLTQRDALNNTTTYAYNLANRSVTVTTPEGVGVTTVHNRQGQTLSVKDGRGNTTSYVYDKSGNLLQTLAPESVGTSTTYDKTGLKLSTTDARGTVTSYAYDAADRMLTRTVDAAGLALVTTYKYDTSGQKISVTDPGGTVTSYRYDLDGQLLQETVDPSNGAYVGLNLQTTYTYDTDGTTLSVQGPDGRLTRYTYDGAGRRIKEQVDPLGLNLTRSYDYDYDGEDNVVKATDGNGNATLYVYDKANRKVFTIDAMGSVRQTSYDAEGRVSAETSYAAAMSLANLQGVAPDLKAMQELLPTLGAAATQRRRYDRDGRLRFTVDGAGGVVEYKYDAGNNLVETRGYAKPINLTAWDPTKDPVVVVDDSRDQRTRNVYDNLGRKTYTVDGTGAVVKQVFDANGNVTERSAYGARVPMATVLAATLTPAAIDSAVATAMASATAARTERDVCAYDRANRQTSHTDGVGTVTTQSFDKNGNVTNRAFWNAQQAGTNLLTQSEFANGVGDAPAKGGAVTAASIAGFRSALRLASDPAGSYAYKTLATTAGATYTLSVIVEMEDGLPPSFGNAAVTNVANSFALVMFANAANPTAYTLQNLGGGRYRVSATGVAPASPGANFGVVKYAGNDTRAFRVTGYQLEQASAAGNLTPTTTTAITAAADAKSQVTGLAYDSAGRLVYTLGPLGQLEKNSYDAAGRVTLVTRYAKAINTTSLGAAPTLAQLDALVQANTNLFTQSEFVNGLADAPSKTGVVSVATMTGLGGALRIAPDPNGPYSLVYKTLATIPGTTYTLSMIVEMEDGLAPAFGNPAVNTAGNSFGMVMFGAGIATNKYVVQSLGNGRYRISTTAVAPAAPGLNFGVVKYTANDARPFRISGFQLEQAAAAGTYVATTTASTAAKDQLQHSVYDKAGRLVASVDALGNTVKYTLNGNGSVSEKRAFYNPVNMASWVPGTVPAPTASDTLDQRTRSFYDPTGRESLTVDALGYAVQRQYDAQGRLSAIVRYPVAIPAATAVTQQAQLDAAIKLASTSGRALQITVYGYDAAGQRISETAAFGQPEAAVTRYVYDGVGRLTRTIDPRGSELSLSDSAWALQQRKLLKYTNAAGGALKAADLTQANRDALAALYTTVNDYDAAGHKISVSDGLGGITRSDYDANGNVVKITDPRGNAAFYYYDAAGHVTLSVDPEGYATATSYDMFGQTLSIKRYFGRVTGTYSAAQAPALPGTNASDALTRFEYDATGRLSRTIDAESNAERYTYNALGQRETLTNKLGGVNTYAYDRLGRVVSETLPITSKNASGQAVAVVNQTTYDAFGNKLTTTEAAGLPEQRLTTYTYDGLNRQLTVRPASVSIYTAAGGWTTAAPTRTSSYDASGNLIVAVDANGGRTRSWFDAGNRKVAEVSATGTLSTWVYDAAGNVMAQNVYGDVLSLPAGDALPVPVNAANVRTTTYQVDANNRVTSSTIAQVEYGKYDTKSNSYNMAATSDLIRRSFYDANGNVLREVNGEGAVAMSWYDKLGQKVLQVDAMGYGVRWERDANGAVFRETRFAKGIALGSTSEGTLMATVLALFKSSPDDQITDYTYDRGNRMLSESRLGVAYGSVNATTGALAENTAAATKRYGYDAMGNRTSVTDALNQRTDLAYDRLGRLLSERKPTALVDTAGNGSASTSWRLTTEYEYDGLNNLRREIRRGANSAVETDDEIVSYGYDATGVRTSMSTGMKEVIRYGRDANGNKTAQMVDRVDADGLVSKDIVSIAYDAANRETTRFTGTRDAANAPIYDVSRTVTLGYNAWGEIASKRTGSGNAAGAAQEYYDYDKAGRLWRTNSQNGVSKAWMYDLAGNATLQLESQRVNLRTMTWDQMAADGGRINPDILITITEYDARNRTVSVKQPKMDAQRPNLKMYAAPIHVDSGQYGGLDIDVAPALAEANSTSILGPASNLVNGQVGTLGMPISGGNIRPITNGEILASGSPREVSSSVVGMTNLVLGSAGIDWTAGIENLYGQVTWRVEVGEAVSHLGRITSWPVSVQPRYDLPGFPPVSVFFDKKAAALGVFPIRVIATTANKQDIVVATGAVRAAPLPTIDRKLSGNFMRLTTGEVRDSDTIQLYHRPAGSSVPFSESLPKFKAGQGGSSLNGVSVDGWYLTDLSSLSSPTELLLVVTQADGKVVRRDSIQWNPSTRQATSSTAPAKPVFTADNVAHFTGMKINGTAIRVSYRAQGSQDKYTELPPLFFTPRPGQQGVDNARFDVRFPPGASDVLIEVLDTNRGVVVDRLSGVIDPRVSRYDVASVGTKPSSITFRGIPADAKTLQITYEPLSAGGRPKATISIPRSEAGSIVEWVWDASSLIPDQRNLYSYKLSFVALDADGFVLTDATGSATIGAIKAGTSARLEGNVRHKVLTFDPGVPEGQKLMLRYRPKGKIEQDFVEATATRGTVTGKVRTVFKWDATAKNLDPAIEYEFVYDVYNAAGSVIANGEGYFRPDSDAGNVDVRWAIPNLPSEQIINTDWVIQRRQDYDAFDHVVMEKDGNEKVTDLRYNTLGLLVDKIGPTVEITSASGQKQTVSPTEHYGYDLNGQLVGKRDANGGLSTVVLNAAGQATAEWHPGTAAGSSIDVRKTYDVFGNLLTVSDELRRLTKNSYDFNNRLTKVERPANLDGSRSSDSYQYDVLGQRISRTNAMSFKERTYYDSMGRVTKYVSAENATVRYDYVYDKTIGSAGGVNTGGWVNTTTDATGKVQTLKNDVFDRLMWKQDFGGHQFTYGYNWSGLIATQTGTSGQNISYSYYDNGYLRKVVDQGTKTESTYEYDNNGNRVFEGFKSTEGGAAMVFQQSRVEYDAFNRVKKIDDARYVIEYDYDANGNRRRVRSSYINVVNGNRDVQEYWYAYDAMNRFTVTMGQLVNGQIVRGSSGDGVAVEYNNAGERTAATYANDGHREDYAYDGAGNMTTMKIDGVLRSRRTNDLAGRVTRYEEWFKDQTLMVQKDRGWNKDNQLTREVEARMVEGTQGKKGSTTTTDYTFKDGTLSTADTLTNTFDNRPLEIKEADPNKEPNGGFNITRTVMNYAYEWWDSAKQASIVLAPTSTAFDPKRPQPPGYSLFTYDVNGHLKTATDINATTPRTFSYWTDAEGRVLQRQELIGGTVNPDRSVSGASKSRDHRYFYFDGRRVGNVGNDGVEREDYAQQLARTANTSNSDDKYRKFRPTNSADFDENYQPVNADFPGSAPGSYTVRAGDTLESVARALWGDATLWYLLADANGLDGQPSAALVANTVLAVPNRVTNVHNTSDTFRPYEPGRAMGETSPTLPDPLPAPGAKEKCGGFGKIITAVVAVVATIWTAGALSGAWGALGTGVAGTSVGTTAVGISGGFSVTMGTGLATLGGGFGATGLAAAVVGGAVGSIAGQAVGIGLGIQDGFDWKGVALGALGAGAAAGIGGWLNGGGLGGALAGPGTWQTAGRMAVTNIATQGLSIATGLQKGFDWRGVAASAASGYVSAWVGQLARDAGWGLTSQRVTSGMASGLTSSVVRGGSLSRALPGIVGDVIGSTVGNALGQSLAGQMGNAGKQQDKLAQVPQQAKVDAAERENILAMFRNDGYSGYAANDAGVAQGILAISVNQKAAAYVSRWMNDGSNAIYRPGMDDATLSPTSEIGGHFTEKQITGQAFVGAINPRTSEPFTQRDLNTLVAYSQFSDQIKDFDATASGLRFFNPLNLGLDFLSSTPMLVQQAQHSLNGYSPEWNLERGLDVVTKNPGNLALAGMALHFTEDSTPHNGFVSPFGHAQENLSGHGPDPMSPELAARTQPNSIRMFEAITGVSADTVLPGQTRSIRENAEFALDRTLQIAGQDGAVGEQFERNFNMAARRDILPADALRLPTLPKLAFGDVFRSSYSEALNTTTNYLNSIGLDMEPNKFLNDAADAYVTIGNHYLDKTGGLLTWPNGKSWSMQPINRNDVFGASPIMPMPGTRAYYQHGEI